MTLHRTPCADCGRKHLSQAKLLLSQAAILWNEMFQGYPEHFSICLDRLEGAGEKLWRVHDRYWDSMGHMAEASDELVVKWPIIANAIRDERLRLQDDPNHRPDFNKLRRMITLAEQAESCG